MTSSNICGQDCYQCSGGLCTACFNSTYTTNILFYSDSCYSSCPTLTYQTSTNQCASCHSSCSVCDGSTYLNCTSCNTNFVDNSNYCVSVCGSGQFYENGACSTCHANCEACISSTVCYVCKTNATLIGSECSFTTCTSLCLTCLGS